MYIQYHILGRHVILMLYLNLMLGPTYLPYFFLAANRNHTYISFRPDQMAAVYIIVPIPMLT